jgi:hypothetical protein
MSKTAITLNTQYNYRSFNEITDRIYAEIICYVPEGYSLLKGEIQYALSEFILLNKKKFKLQSGKFLQNSEIADINACVDEFIRNAKYHFQTGNYTFIKLKKACKKVSN